MSGHIPQGETGKVITTETGEQYYILGKNRIKITEHFPPDGKCIEELVTTLIECKTKEKVSKIS